MTRPTTHAEDCCFEDGPSDLFCTCALAERQRIFDLEQRVAGMPEVGPPDDDSSGGDWRWSAEWLRGEIAVSVSQSPEVPRLITVSGHRDHTAEEARWLAAALLAAANEAER